MVTSVKSPCLHCNDRCIGCHGKCDRYKDYQDKLECEKSIINESKNKNDIIYNYKKDSILKMKKIQRGKRHK